MNLRLLSAIVVLAALLRFWDLAAAPPFIDEDLYTQTAFRMRGLNLSDAVQFTVASGTGKSPLYFLLQASIMDLVGDAVMAGRVLSAAAGIVSVIACGYLGGLIGSKYAGVAAALGYAVSPLAVLHERMVLVDASLAAFSLIATVGTWVGLTRHSPRWIATALVSGALAVQFKTPGIALAVVPYIAFLTNLRPFLRHLILATIIAAGSAASFALLMASPLGSELAKDSTGRLNPFAFASQNSSSLIDTLNSYVPAPLLFVSLVGIIWGLVVQTRLSVFLLVCMMLRVVPWVVLGNFSPSRYYLPALPFLIVFSVMPLVSLTRDGPRIVAIVAGMLSVCWLVGTMLATSASWRLANDHASATMSTLDDWQYRSGWPSGYAYADARRFLHDHVESGATVLLGIDAGHYSSIGFWQVKPREKFKFVPLQPQDPLLTGRNGPVYVVLGDAAFHPSRMEDAATLNPRMELIADFVHPNSDVGVSVWRIP